MKAAIRSLCLLLALSPAIASAQQFNTIPSGTVIGRTAAGAGPAQAIPLGSIQSATLPNNSVTNAKITPGAANTMKGSLNGSTTSDITLVSCSALYTFTQWISGTGWQCGIIPVLPSRAVAKTLNLAAFNAITTQGYANPGDGGGATFKNVGSAPFIDSFANACTLTGGSGYTTDTYFGVLLSGGTGRGIYATVSVSGGAVTAVSYTFSPGNAYTAGDVLTATAAQIGGTGSGFSCTIPSVTSPLGSFADTGGVHWQIIPKHGTNDVLQFGAVADWIGTDNTATDNYAAFQAASWYATYYFDKSLFTNGPLAHAKIMVPGGEYMVCNGGVAATLIVAQGVTFEGIDSQGSFIRFCDAWSTTFNYVDLCDPTWHSACFGAWLRKLQISSNRNLANIASGAYAVYSNNVQDWGGLENVKVGAGSRCGLFFEKGYGGASYGPVLDNVEVGANSTCQMVLIGNTVGSGTNFGTTIILIRGLNLGGPGSSPLQSGPGVVFQGGYSDVTGLHCEQIPSCVQVNIPSGANGGTVRLHNINAAGSPVTCNEVINLASTNVPGNTVIGTTVQGGCTHTVTDSQSGGSNITGDIVLDRVVNP